MTVEINNESGWQVDARPLEEAAKWVFRKLKISPRCELSILFTDPDSIALLHEQYMGLEGPTDVLSFPMDEIRPGKGAQGMLGDIMICPQVASIQAKCTGHRTIEEILLLETHGILHLLGFDHNSDKLQRQMFALQRYLLFTFLCSYGEIRDAGPGGSDANL
ncbi:MAG: rRNA maturation RNase YbeY [Aeriscardovia sp.]|nr:rRNA maturation RNase YbeY [Aeriscardovia sp.]